jgi:hypothetical protein
MHFIDPKNFEELVVFESTVNGYGGTSALLLPFDGTLQMPQAVDRPAHFGIEAVPVQAKTCSIHTIDRRRRRRRRRRRHYARPAQAHSHPPTQDRSPTNSSQPTMMRKLALLLACLALAAAQETKTDQPLFSELDEAEFKQIPKPMLKVRAASTRVTVRRSMLI